MNSSEKKFFLSAMKSPLVVDIDFSAWDKFVRIVVAVAPDEEFSAQSDLYNVDFVRVTTIAWNAQGAVEFESNETQHTRWQIWGVELDELAEGYRVELRSSAPDLNIECQDIRMSPLDGKLLVALNPAWFKPGEPLARRSLEMLAESFTHRRPGKSGR
jgi:hypothetical protein